nr:aminoacyl-tRNA hydrolase [Corynebacterium tapiri]
MKWLNFFRRRPPEVSWLIVGLGNPGSEYVDTRHNVGFAAVDTLVDELRPQPRVNAEGAIVGKALAVKPLTYMNASGEAVAPLARRLGVAPENIVVIHDELDLPEGAIKIKRGGNENGHNGLKSLTAELGTRDYIRIRVGIGRPPKGVSVPDYVLDRSENDQTQTINTAAEAARLVTTEGLERAQHKIHSKR